jgi:hypothetical protein
MKDALKTKEQLILAIQILRNKSATIKSENNSNHCPIIEVSNLAKYKSSAKNTSDYFYFIDRDNPAATANHTSAELQACAVKIKILNINKQYLKLLEAKSKKELMDIVLAIDFFLIKCIIGNWLAYHQKDDRAIWR